MRESVTKRCDVEGCSKAARTNGSPWCANHYMTNWRRGITRPRAISPRLDHSSGYFLVHAPDHPLTVRHTGTHEYEHRVVFYDAHGEGPFSCHWCQKQVTWEDMHVDHLNDMPTDNRVENLVASCPLCNQKRGRVKMVRTLRRTQGRMLTWNSEQRSIGEWADLAGIARQSLVWRLKNGWSMERALTEQRGKHGPRRVKRLGEWRIEASRDCNATITAKQHRAKVRT